MNSRQREPVFLVSDEVQHKRNGKREWYSIQLFHACLVNSIQLFHACLVNSQNNATRCRGQLNALLPEAARPRAIVH